MTEPRERTAQDIGHHAEAPPELGTTILEREIPSEVALVTPLIIRATDFLESEGLLLPEFKSKFQLCIDEALRNAVVHGNKRDFSKKVKLIAFLSDSCWGVRIEDEGRGFAPQKVPDPREEQSLWGESGRGLHLMAHYMDKVDYYLNGRVLVLQKHL